MKSSRRKALAVLLAITLSSAAQLPLVGQQGHIDLPWVEAPLRLDVCPNLWFLERLGAPAGQDSVASDVGSGGFTSGTTGEPNTFGDPIGHAFLLFRFLGRIDLGTLGGSESWSTAVNDSAQVTGGSLDAYGYAHAFRYSGLSMTDLGYLAGGYSEGRGINNLGHVVGMATNGQNRERAFLWKPETGMVDLGTLGGDTASAEGINNAGEIAGASTFLPGVLQRSHAFRYSGGVMTDVGTLGGESSIAYRINSAGHMVGSAQVPNGEWHATLWLKGQPPIDLHPNPPTAGTNLSVATDINSAGVIVGGVWMSDGYHAVQWEYDAVSGGYVLWDLNVIRPAGSNYLLTKATGINDTGQISGKLSYPGGLEAFLVTPVNVKSVQLASNSVLGGYSVQGTIRLTNPAPSAVSVSLKDNHPAASAPSTVTVGARNSTATFQVNTVPVSSNRLGSFSGRVGSPVPDCGGTGVLLTVMVPPIRTP